MNAPADLPLGLRYGLPIEEYHGDVRSISNTGLQRFAKSPEIFFGQTLDPLRPPAPEQTPAQLAGHLAHCAILEPTEFGARYAVGPNVSRATKEWKNFAELNADKVCIKPDQYTTAMRQADSVRKHPDIRRALEKGAPEVSAYWIDPKTGVRCRCRPDWVNPVDDAGVVLLDVKTYSDASAREFERQVGRMGYHIQDAWYSRGFQIASDMEVHAFIFVAVETDYPHAANALMLDPSSREEGLRQIDALLPQYAHCLATNTWPGYSETIQNITLPRYLFK